jgi:hypothetical protein
MMNNNAIANGPMNLALTRLGCRVIETEVIARSVP